jgi:hypothetical protein
MKDLKKEYTSPGAQALADAEELMEHADKLWQDYLTCTEAGAKHMAAESQAEALALAFYAVAQAKFTAAQFYLSR